jgi:hypothetical protein
MLAAFLPSIHSKLLLLLLHIGDRTRTVYTVRVRNAFTTMRIAPVFVLALVLLVCYRAEASRRGGREEPIRTPMSPVVDAMRAAREYLGDAASALMGDGGRDPSAQPRWFGKITKTLSKWAKRSFPQPRNPLKPNTVPTTARQSTRTPSPNREHHNTHAKPAFRPDTQRPESQRPTADTRTDELAHEVVRLRDANAALERTVDRLLVVVGQMTAQQDRSRSRTGAAEQAQTGCEDNASYEQRYLAAVGHEGRTTVATPLEGEASTEARRALGKRRVQSWRSATATQQNSVSAQNVNRGMVAPSGETPTLPYACVVVVWCAMWCVLVAVAARVLWGQTALVDGAARARRHDCCSDPESLGLYAQLRTLTSERDELRESVHNLYSQLYPVTGTSK